MATYYERYVLLSAPEHHAGTRGRYTTWACFLMGEEIGKIEHCTDRYTTEKPYEAMVRITSKDWIRHRHVGWFDTLIEAKAALLEPGYEYLQESDKQLQESSIPLSLLPAVDSEFYPTPATLAGQLLSGVDWDQVDSILEPNAGMGNLIDYAQRCIYGYYRKSNYGKRELDDVDCVELDPNLRAILVSKGYRVVHDDFLDYHTRKRYSLILMNPPFSNGEMHLLHAIGICASGGQIACILNAETIRNPFSNSRKALLKELKRYGASIRYVNNAFAHAPRRARVDVALINLHIPFSNVDTSIWDELQQAKDATLPDQENQTQLAPGNQIERLLREYDLLCKAGISLMAKYNGVAPHIHNSRKSSYSSPLIKLQIVGHSCDDVCSSEDVNRFLRAVRSRYWRELFDLPDLRERMTSTMKDEYHSTIDRMENYEFSPFNIQQVLDQIRGQLRQGVEDAIIKCFDKLSAEHTYHSDIHNENVHYYNSWKSNKAHYVNAKCVIPTYGCFARGYKWDKNGRYKDTLEGLDVRGCFGVLDDLEKALDYLDKGETIAIDLSRRLQYAASDGRTTVVCKYFTVKFFKKGTCHVKFHNQKIVDRLNIYVGRQRAWLPPSYGTVRYSEMDEESQRVVDEFQGADAYDEVMRDPKDYIIETKTPALLIA